MAVRGLEFFGEGERVRESEREGEELLKGF